MVLRIYVFISKMVKVSFDVQDSEKDILNCFLDLEWNIMKYSRNAIEPPMSPCLSIIHATYSNDFTLLFDASFSHTLPTLTAQQLSRARRKTTTAVKIFLYLILISFTSAFPLDLLPTCGFVHQARLNLTNNHVKRLAWLKPEIKLGFYCRYECM